MPRVASLLASFGVQYETRWEIPKTRQAGGLPQSVCCYTPDLQIGKCVSKRDECTAHLAPDLVPPQGV